MNDAQLENLLREAAQTTALPNVPADLAGQVRRKYLRGRRTFQLSGLAVVALLACLGIYSLSFIFHPSSFPPSPAISMEEHLERLDRKLDQLSVKIGEQQRELTQMVEYQQALKTYGSQAADMTDYGMALRQRIQAEQAGYMLVGLGEDFLALSQPSEAIKNFMKVAENFPDTIAAGKAKEHLARLKIKD